MKKSSQSTIYVHRIAQVSVLKMIQKSQTFKMHILETKPYTHAQGIIKDFLFLQVFFFVLFFGKAN